MSGDLARPFAAGILLGEQMVMPMSAQQNPKPLSNSGRW
jgi:hypothetical protein